jgi:hypothetical protein
MLLHPSARLELPNDRLIKLAFRGVVDSLEAGLCDAQLGLLQRARDPLVLPPEPLGINEHAEPLVEAEGIDLSVLLLLRPRGQEALQAERF